jgi:GNAT superfamily N-acetyltransferase
MEIRPYVADTDLEAVHRIWREVGWIEGDNDGHKQGLEIFAGEFDGLVAVINEAAECYVATGLGTIRHTGTDVSMSAVVAVTTSHVARRQGLAQKLTAASIARDAAAGAKVSSLGIFDQGFYNKLGFGTGSYERWHSIDPAHLRVPVTARPPRRLSKDDWETVHQSRINRFRGHGACNLDAQAATRAEMLWASNGFGFGYPDGPNGEITHHIWFSSKEMESGPWNAWWMAYQTTDQFLELMALVASFGDQVQLFRVREPAGIQLQDLVKEPFRRRRISEKSRFEAHVRSDAYWQFRICDVEGCVAATTVDGPPRRFNLKLTDPIEPLLGEDAEWRGVGGSYIVEFAHESTAEPGEDPALPTLEASVGAFSRMWLGVLPASGLATTDDLQGPDELIADLDRALRFPVPKPDWDF